MPKKDLKALKISVKFHSEQPVMDRLYPEFFGFTRKQFWRFSEIRDEIEMFIFFPNQTTEIWLSQPAYATDVEMASIVSRIQRDWEKIIDKAVEIQGALSIDVGDCRTVEFEYDSHACPFCGYNARSVMEHDMD